MQERSWKCSECGVEFGESDHKHSIIRIDGQVAIACTHHPDALDRATLILGGSDCALAYARKNPDQAGEICAAIAVFESMRVLAAHRGRVGAAQRSALNN